VDHEALLCTVCDDVHYGGSAPEICPTCETMGLYVEVTKDEAEEYFL
jgi:rubrerythrin